MNKDLSYDPSYEPVTQANDVTLWRRFFSGAAVRLYYAARWCESVSFGNLVVSPAQYIPLVPLPPSSLLRGDMTPLSDLGAKEQLELALKNETIREAVIAGATRPKRTPEECRAIINEHIDGPASSAFAYWKGPNYNTENKDEEVFD